MLRRAWRCSPHVHGHSRRCPQSQRREYRRRQAHSATPQQFPHPSQEKAPPMVVNGMSCIISRWLFDVRCAMYNTPDGPKQPRSDCLCTMLDVRRTIAKFARVARGSLWCGAMPSSQPCSIIHDLPSCWLRMRKWVE